MISYGQKPLDKNTQQHRNKICDPKLLKCYTYTQNFSFIVLELALKLFLKQQWRRKQTRANRHSLTASSHLDAPTHSSKLAGYEDIDDVTMDPFD